MRHYRKVGLLTTVSTTALLIATVASAQIAPPPPGPGGGSSSSGGSNGKGGGKGGGKGLAVGQLAAGACATISIAGTAVRLEHRYVWDRVGGKWVRVHAPRELTPLEAAEHAARCGSYAGIIVYGVSKAMGLRDTACNIAVAAEAYAVNSARLAIEQRAFARDGSDPTWNHVQNLIHAKQVQCYLNGRKIGGRGR